VELIESGPDRLVVHIPPGGKSTGGIGCFAFAWNAFMAVFTVPWVFALASDDGAPVAIIVPVLLLFWAVGIGFFYAWLRMKRMRTYVLVEPERVVLQSEAFGRKSMLETGLASGSAVGLVVSYSINDKPVHTVAVPGNQRTLTFGTQLSEQEKEWLVETINGFLKTDDPQGLPNFCTDCGQRLDPGAFDADADVLACPQCGEAISRVHQFQPLTVPEAAPADLPPDSPVRIEEYDVERLTFSLPLFPAGSTRSGVALGIGLFGFVWLAVVGFSFARMLGSPRASLMEWFFLVVNGLFLIPGFALLLAGFVIPRGRIAVSVDHDWLQVRWHCGPLGYTKRLASVAIERVQLSVGGKSAELRTMKPATTLPASDKVVVATVHVGSSVVPLTTCHSLETTRQVAGLVRTQLTSMGMRLAT
jgi:hypothetical protein